MRTLLASLSVVFLLTAASAVRAEDEWVTKTTDRTVPEAVNALKTAIENAGATVMATVDHAANATSASLDLPSTTVVIFGNPKIGTPLMQKNRRIAIDLPQKILVWDDNGQTTIGYVTADALAARYGIDPSNELIQMMGGALDKLSSAAAAPAAK